jgi:hypothetical protein
MPAELCADDCGEPAVQQWDEGAEYAFWTRQPRYVQLCAECWTRRDNREPPDQTGEPPVSLMEQYRMAADEKRRLQ